VELDGVSVPEHMAIPEEIPLRGGPHFRQRDLPAAAYEHAAIAVGLGRRAVQAAVAAIASRATRHETTLNALGRASVNLEMVSLAVEAEFTRVCELLDDPETDADAVSANNPAIAAHAMDVAMDCVETAYRLAGAMALYTPNVFERLLRDAHAASQHACVQDFHFTNVGRRLIDGLARDR
jgi:alkylation response protein AidB-like acyl-CoA dehydrogenase